MLSVEERKLSIEECKKYLKGAGYTEQEIVEMRDELYQLATILVKNYIGQKKQKKEKCNGE